MPAPDFPRAAAALIDLDGTLVDSNALHVEAWEIVFREAGVPQPRDAIRSQIGKGGDNLVPALLPDLAPARASELADRHGALFKRAYIDRVRPFPGAADLLEGLHAAGIRVVLASSAGGDEVEHYVALLGTGRCVDAITSKDDVAHSKPAPDIFAAALREAGVGAQRALAVGDTPYDVIAAAGCSVACIALLSGGFPEEELRAQAPRAILADVAALHERRTDFFASTT